MKILYLKVFMLILADRDMAEVDSNSIEVDTPGTGIDAGDAFGQPK